MKLTNRLRCWLRNYHRWHVASLVNFRSFTWQPFAAYCIDCGAKTVRTATDWRKAEEAKLTTDNRQLTTPQ
jgi:hypothetical protein